jgi:nitrogen PTS system EIIA component
MPAYGSGPRGAVECDARARRARRFGDEPRPVGPSMEGRMKLLDFVVKEAILVDLQATGKEEAIREMVGSLHRAGRLADNDVESVIRAILGREELGSTGIGQGVAVPHTRHPTLQRLIGTVALSRRGVDFAALDGEPVDIFFLLVSPQNQPGDHLRALENISRHLKDERFVSFLRQSQTRENVIEVLEEADHGSP